MIYFYYLNNNKNTLNMEPPSLQWKPDIIVLGSGGVKGFLHLGALCALKEYHMLDHVKTYVGVSVGAIVALLCVIGYNISEIIVFANETSLFNDFSTINFSE